MNVLWQIWTIGEGVELNSISKDSVQLQNTIRKLAAQQAASSDLDQDEAVPKGDPQEIEIPDDSIFAQMVEDRTIFLHEDELDIIFNNLSDN